MRIGDGGRSPARRHQLSRTVPRKVSGWGGPGLTGTGPAGIVAGSTGAAGVAEPGVPGAASAAAGLPGAADADGVAPALGVAEGGAASDRRSRRHLGSSDRNSRGYPGGCSGLADGRGLTRLTDRHGPGRRLEATDGGLYVYRSRAIAVTWPVLLALANAWLLVFQTVTAFPSASGRRLTEPSE